MDIAIQLLFITLISISLFSLLTVGFSMIYSVSKVLHLAHGSLMVASSYIVWWLSVQQGLNLWLAIIISLLAAAGLGVAMNFFVYEPMRARKRGRVSSIGTLVATLALMLIFQNVLLIFFGPRIRTFPYEFANYNIGGALVNTFQLSIIITAVMVLALFWLFIKKTKLGKAMRATSDNSEVAEIIGINTKKIRYLTFAVSSLVAGIAGILFGIEIGLEPSMSVRLAVGMFFRGVVGGIGSFAGAVVGTVAVDTVVNLGSWFINSAYESIYSFILVFIVLLIKPSGIFGVKKK